MPVAEQKDEYLTLEQAAERFGKSISSIRKYISQGHIKRYRRRSDVHVYVRTVELEELLTEWPPKAVDGEE